MSKYSDMNINDLVNMMVDAERAVSDIKYEIKRRAANDDVDMMEFITIDWSKMRKYMTTNRLKGSTT